MVPVTVVAQARIILPAALDGMGAPGVKGAPGRFVGRVRHRARRQQWWQTALRILVLALVLTLAVFYATWWIFQDPRGWMRMYTPYVGYMYTRWWLIMLIWMVYIFNYWPFKRRWLENTHPLFKGAVLTVISVVILWVLIKGFFESLLGNYGIAYFNPDNLMKLPRMTEFFALEYASLACLMFAAIASWLSPAWVVACEEVPWQDMRQPGKGISILVATFFLSTLIFFMTMHSHMGILYYPWQYFTSIAPPYWEKFANTVSGNFHVAWIMCCTVTVWIVETIWERFPFKLIRTNWLRRIVAFGGRPTVVGAPGTPRSGGAGTGTGSSRGSPWDAPPRNRRTAVDTDFVIHETRETLTS